jgi:hypothetical protein
VAALLGSGDGSASDDTVDGPEKRGVFGRLFGAAREPFVGGEDQDLVTAPAGVSSAAAETPDPSFDAARGELAGLMDRVRGLSRQYRKS